ncbi:MAG: hypothetical protein SH820_02710 [Xanthomonadales bacterium]|nr:hypothetical protein [Xanthomonadales bacterium]
MLSTSAFAQQAVAEPAVTPAADVETIANQALAEEVNESSAEDTAEVLDPAMQIPLDGSSLEAFNESLATIKAQAEEINFTSLEGAIQYLLVYDLGAGRDMAKLAKNLDGLTGDQIIEKVKWGK